MSTKTNPEFATDTKRNLDTNPIVECAYIKVDTKCAHCQRIYGKVNKYDVIIAGRLSKSTIDAYYHPYDLTCNLCHTKQVRCNECITAYGNPEIKFNKRCDYQH